MVNMASSRVENGIGVLTLTDRGRLNVLSATLVEEAQAAHQEFIEQGVRVAVLAAEGPAFCSGRDAEAVRVPGVPPAGATFIDEIENSPIAWVAAVDGSVIGAGIHLMSTCMHVVAGPSMRVRVPELRDGIYPRPVAAELSSIIGARQTMHLMLTAEALTASDALAAGLVSEVVDAEEVMDRAMGRAEVLNGLSDELLLAARAGWRSRFVAQ